MVLFVFSLLPVALAAGSAEDSFCSASSFWACCGVCEILWGISRKGLLSVCGLWASTSKGGAFFFEYARMASGLFAPRWPYGAIWPLQGLWQRCFTPLSLLAYNVGAGRILGNGKHPKSQLLRKIEAGDRNIYGEYASFCRYKGKVLSGLVKRRQVEFALFFNSL